MPSLSPEENLDPFRNGLAKKDLRADRVKPEKRSGPEIIQEGDLNAGDLPGLRCQVRVKPGKNMTIVTASYYYNPGWPLGCLTRPDHVAGSSR